MASPKGRVQSVEFYEPIFFVGLRQPLPGHCGNKAGGGSRIGRRAPRNVAPARLHSDVKTGGQMSSFIMTISRTIFFRVLAHAPEELQREAKENVRGAIPALCLTEDDIRK